MPLTPGKRIDLKKRIAATLSQQPWEEIDLTLGEFGLPITDDWQGDAKQYALAMIQSATEEALTELDAYLHPTAGPPAPPQPNAFSDSASPWSGQGFRLFISHISRYAKQAGAIREELAKRSIDAFVAHEAIEPTADWIEVIGDALRSCDGCLAFLTPGFRESAWTDQEIGFCMARDLLVVPVEYGLVPYGFLGRYQALPVKENHAAANAALGVFDLLVRKSRSRAAMAKALVDRWAQTPTWDAARENFSFLRKIPTEVWTQQLVDQVWEACERNSQLSTANITYRPSLAAVENLFADIPLTRTSSAASAEDDDIPF